MPRYLGQHFLINKAAIQKIITALDLQENDAIIEIGPGQGALTLPLAEKCQKLGCQIVAIEKDPLLAKRVEGLGYSHIKVLIGDALKILPPLAKPYKIVGNIPYYITGKLLRILSELPQKPELIVLTVQREVAERIVAQAPKMNLLAAATQIWADAKIIGRLKPSDFKPAPKVESAIVKLEIRNLPAGRQGEKIEKRMLENYYKFIKIAFKQPRKTLLNNLAAGLKTSKYLVLAKIKKAGLTGQERPQDLTLTQLMGLSQP